MKPLRQSLCKHLFGREYSNVGVFTVFPLAPGRCGSGIIGLLSRWFPRQAKTADQIAQGVQGWYKHMMQHGSEEKNIKRAATLHLPDLFKSLQRFPVNSLLSFCSISGWYGSTTMESPDSPVLVSVVTPKSITNGGTDWNRRVS